MIISGEPSLSGGLPTRFPIFPLPGAILLPRARLPLNIFEPRYLTMIDDAMRDGRLIGMVQPINGDETRRLTLYGWLTGRITILRAKPMTGATSLC